MRVGSALRPANLNQAAAQARGLLTRRLPGARATTVRTHLQRAGRIAEAIYRRWQVGVYQWQVKHVRWYLEVCTGVFSPSTRYRYWLTTRLLVMALGKDPHWLHHLNGPWLRPISAVGDLKAGRPIKRPM